MGVANWFETFCSNISVRNNSTISDRYKAITRRLNTDFWTTTSDTAHSLYVGSYGRNTAINGFSDLDMLFQLPYSDYEKYNAYQTNGQSALLQAVKASIQKTYPSTDLGADGQVVVTRFSDGPTFEVLPAFINTDGSFTHPDSNSGGSWKQTNPKPEIAAIQQRNGECNGNLVPLCRMMRAWKSKRNVPIGGLLIDTLAYRFIADWQHRDKSYLYYDFMCRDFFDFMAKQSTTQDYWLAPGSCQYVYRKGEFEGKAGDCYTLALEAITYATDNKDWSAKQKWREVFGASYPD